MASRHIIRPCHWRLDNLRFLKRIQLSSIAYTPCRSNPYELTVIFLATGFGGVGAKALRQSGDLRRGASHGRANAIFKVARAFTHAMDIEVPDLDQESNWCLVPTEFSFFGTLLANHVAILQGSKTPITIFFGIDVCVCDMNKRKEND